MDGSIEGDINELSYSPIVVTVYFVWVRATLYIHAFIHSFIHLFIHLQTLITFFPSNFFFFRETKFRKTILMKVSC